MDALIEIYNAGGWQAIAAIVVGFFTIQLVAFTFWAWRQNRRFVEAEAQRKADAESAREQLRQEAERARMEMEQAAEQREANLQSFFMRRIEETLTANTALQEQNADFSKRIGELTAKVTELEHENSRWKGLYEGVQNDYSRIEKKLTEVSQEFELLKLERTQLHGQITEQRRMLREKEAELKQQSKTIAHYEAIIADQQAKIDALEKRIKSLEDEMRNAKSQGDIPDAA